MYRRMQEGVSKNERAARPGPAHHGPFGIEIMT
jgi:hypothetical protein